MQLDTINRHEMIYNSDEKERNYFVALSLKT